MLFGKPPHNPNSALGAGMAAQPYEASVPQYVKFGRARTANRWSFTTSAGDRMDVHMRAWRQKVERKWYAPVGEAARTRPPRAPVQRHGEDKGAKGVPVAAAHGHRQRQLSTGAASLPRLGSCRSFFLGAGRTNGLVSVDLGRPRYGWGVRPGPPAGENDFHPSRHSDDRSSGVSAGL